MTDKKFTHDCDCCIFLGHAKGRDWYSCSNSQSILGRSIIARFGDDGPDYSSCPLFCCHELTQIEKMALSLGLELTEAEEKKLFKILLKKEKEKLYIQYYPDNEFIGKSDYFEIRLKDEKA